MCNNLPVGVSNVASLIIPNQRGMGVHLIVSGHIRYILYLRPDILWYVLGGKSFKTENKSKHYKHIQVWKVAGDRYVPKGMPLK